MPGPLQFTDETEIETVVRNFEECSYPPQDFTHAHHLTVAAWYLRNHSSAQTLDKMRQALQRFTAHHNVKGYHETITRFWIEIVAAFLVTDRGESAVETINQLLLRHSRKDEIFDYYSRERLLSDAAREDWIEPDLQLMPLLAGTTTLPATTIQQVKT